MMRLYLSDQYARPLGRRFGANSQTAAGTGTAQSTLGNLDFTAVLRLDVVLGKSIHELATPPIPHSLPARFDRVMTSV